jgi:hypothetical protein
LLEQVAQRIGGEHYGEERQESQAKRAERLVHEEMTKRKFRESDLSALAKGDPQKIQRAQRLRLQMGSVACVSNRLYVNRNGFKVELAKRCLTHALQMAVTG